MGRVFIYGISLVLCGCTTIDEARKTLQRATNSDGLTTEERAERDQKEASLPKPKRVSIKSVYKAIGSKELHFENGEISILYTPNMTSGTIGLVVKNKTNSMMKLVWDESTFVQNNISDRVLPDGARFINRDSSQAPLAIAPKTLSTTSVSPVSAVRHSSYVGWVIDPVCGEKSDRTEFKDGKYVKVPADIGCVGQKFAVVLTYEIDGRKKFANMRFEHAGHIEVEDPEAPDPEDE